MEELLHIQKTFDKINFINKTVSNREFEECTFINCDFSNSTFSSSTFLECEFIDCNLSMIKLQGTGLKDCSFRNCKLLGILFDECDDFLFQVRFEECVLDYASFSNKKMLKTAFISCSLIDVSFIGSQLNQANFAHSNLAGAIFDNTQLAGADFSTAVNFKIDPEYNPMKKAKFSNDGLVGLLDKYDLKIQ
jgi:uncharacterized protein YjbI with pentapeptide repeats